MKTEEDSSRRLSEIFKDMEKRENRAVRKGLWNFIDRIEGDKVVWVIVFLLLMISWLAIFSSTPLLALEMKTDRLSIMKEQIIITGLGLGIIFALYSIRKIGILRWFSQLGFGLSFVLLLILDTHADLKFIKAENINDAWRTLSLFGKVQFHVFEVVKVAMIMYLSWAIHEYRCDIKEGKRSKHLKLANRLAQNKNLDFLAKPFWKKVMYIYFPLLSITGMVMYGSNSSALIVGGVMLATLAVGGLEMKEVWIGIISVAAIAGLAYGTYKLSDGRILKSRFETLESRLTMNTDPTQLLDPELRKDKEAYQKKLDKLRQPNAAMIAVHEGGLIGKGPGGSTQKYIVPVMFGDYMFSFLLEEYGLWGGIIIIILYVSLLARGSWIARLCDSDFAKTAVGGLTLLISAQAFLHMYINVGLGPLTGQTLPLVSHGNSSFLSFCVAFGVILSISRMANNKIREEEAAAEPIYKKDDIQSSMDVLEQIDNDEFNF